MGRFNPLGSNKIITNKLDLHHMQFSVRILSICDIRYPITTTCHPICVLFNDSDKNTISKEIISGFSHEDGRILNAKQRLQYFIDKCKIKKEMEVRYKGLRKNLDFNPVYMFDDESGVIIRNDLQNL